MKEMKYIWALNEALREEMARDERVIYIGEDVRVGTWGASKGLCDEFGPKRVIDTPLSESAIAGIGVGAAIEGLRPVVEIMFFDFIALAVDAIVNSAAKMRYVYGGQYKVPVVYITFVGAGLNTGPHHSQSFEAWFCHVPGLTVVYPSTPPDVKGLLKAAIRDDNPVLFIYHNIFRATGEIPEEDYILPLGRATVKREGTDVTIVTWGRLFYKVATSAEKLATEGIDVEIVDLGTLIPLDTETIIESVKKTGHLLIAHESVKTGGFGAEVAASVMEEAFGFLDAPIKRIGAAFTPMPFGTALEQAVLPQEADIIGAVKGIV